MPLAALAALIGWLVLGSLQGQVSAASAHSQQAHQAGGLGLAIQEMNWMSNDMTGEGPVKKAAGFSMPASEMPGMQPVGTNRLHVEVSLSNVASDVQRYAMSEFSVAAPGGKSWRVFGDSGSDTATSGILEPGFTVTIDLYFDVPTGQSKNLTVKWSHGGSKVSIPVNTDGTQPGKMIM